MFTYNQVVIIITFFGFFNKPEGEKLQECLSFFFVVFLFGSNPPPPAYHSLFLTSLLVFCLSV